MSSPSLLRSESRGREVFTLVILKLHLVISRGDSEASFTESPAGDRGFRDTCGPWGLRSVLQGGTWEQRLVDARHLRTVNSVCFYLMAPHWSWP